MKVLNLQCSRQHSFEGWFGSEEDFQDQLGRALIECPLCADKGIQKMPSAPRLNFGAQQVPARAPAEPAGSLAEKTSSEVSVPPGARSAGSQLVDAAPPSAAVQAAFLTALRQVLSKTEDVGERFADEARRIHYGETEARAIRGQASAREAVDLMEEGIEVMALPMLAALKETLQ